MEAEDQTMTDLMRGIRNILPRLTKTFFINLNGKSEIAEVCPLKRTNRGERVYCTLKQLKDNGLFTMEFLNRCNERNLFEGGIYISIVNEELEEIENSETEESRFLLDSLGGDGNVSSLIHIRSEKGNSGSAAPREFYERFASSYIEERDLQPISRREGITSPVGRGNEKIQGHFVINLKGGSNNSICNPNVSGARYQIFNPINGYADEYIQRDRLAKFLYLYIHAGGIETIIKDDAQRNSYKSLLEEYMRGQNYDDGNLFEKTLRYSYHQEGVDDYVVEFIIDGILTCPLTNEQITVERFRDGDNPVQICHEESAADNKLYFDQTQGRVCTAVRPNNLFFGYKLGNMQQQNMDIITFHKNWLQRAQTFQGRGLIL